jgi:hypothetical protein
MQNIHSLWVDLGSQTSAGNKFSDYSLTIIFLNILTLELSDEIIDALSIDCIIFGFKHAELSLLLVKHSYGASKGL